MDERFRAHRGAQLRAHCFGQRRATGRNQGRQRRLAAVASVSTESSSGKPCSSPVRSVAFDAEIGDSGDIRVDGACGENPADKCCGAGDRRHLSLSRRAGLDSPWRAETALHTAFNAPGIRQSATCARIEVIFSLHGGLDVRRSLNADLKLAAHITETCR